MFRKSKPKEAPVATVEDGKTATAPEPAPAGDGVTANGGEDLAPVQKTTTEDIVYPSGLRLALILLSTFMSMFITSLDRLIITTAIPRITDEFHSVNDIGWYGSAYMLTMCSFQLQFGKLYTVFSIKGVLLSSVLLFEVGSAVCGAAPSSIAFIIGRAIAGVGAGGISSGATLVLVYSVPLHKRPMFQGMFGAVFGLASVAGPLIGGAFTTDVSWRWCFYINLPMGAVVMMVILLLLKIPDRDTTKLPLKEKLAQLDVYGTALLIPGCVCLILALEWGGSTYPWSDGRIIALLVLCGVLLIGFVLVQIYLPKTATIPPRIFLQRSILAGCWSIVCTGSQMTIFAYFLPIWFQAIQGVSAVESGIRILPLLLALVVASLMTGVLVRRIGYYTPFLIVGVCLSSVGAGLLNTFQLSTPEGKWIGYQIVYGFGLGCSAQAPNVAAQTVLPRRDIAIGTSLMYFSQLFGGAIFVSVAQNVLDSQLLRRLSSVPGLKSGQILNGGATSLTDLPESIRRTVLVAYNESLRHVFQVGLVIACLGVLGALAMEWRSVKKDANKPKASVENGGKEGEGKGETDSGDHVAVEGRKGEAEKEKETTV